jgi:probable phosphoglycerate mutase
MLFYLIRHGQTDWNIGRRIQGETDVSLNGLGRLQAEAAGKAMREIPVDVIYSSDLSRALETAQAVSRLHDGGPVPVRSLPEFEEVSFGEWEGRSLTEVGEKWPELYTRWKQNATAVTPPGGEAPAAVRARVARGFQKIGADREKTPFSSAVITAHGAVLEYVFDWLLRNEAEHREIIVENASISRVFYDFETGEGKILELNRVDHLGELRGKKLV